MSVDKNFRITLLNQWLKRTWQRYKIGVMALLMSLGCCLGIVTHVWAVEPTPAVELRGVWLTNIDSDVLFSPQNLSQGLQRLKRLNFNTLYPTVWNGGYTLYSSTVAESVIGQALDPEPKLQNRDLLAEIIERGHSRGFAIIPWFEFGFMAPAESDLARRHPNWISQRQDGSQVVMEGQWPRVWLSPFRPEVQQFMVDLVTDAVRRYDLDGIQFDDHFGLPVELGYDPYTIQAYQQEHQGQSPPDDPRNPEWVRWRADKLTEVMAKIFHAVKAIRPDCLVALSPNPQEFAFSEFLQDWQTWERQGLIEELIVQVYRNTLEGFVAELNTPSIQAARRHIPVGIGILTGLKNRPSATELVLDQVEAARKAGFAGVSFFFYESLGLRDAAIAHLFDQPAQRPILRTSSQTSSDQTL